MTSLINIHSAKAYWTGTNSVAMFLFENTGTYGYSNIKITDSLGVTKGTYLRCLQPRSVLKYFDYVLIPEQLISVTLIPYRCNSDAEQNCGTIPITCSNEIQSGTGLTIPVADPWIRQTPSIPPNLVVSSLDSALRITWDISTNADFAYLIRLFNGINMVLNAYTESTLRDITINGLTNGVLYDVYVWGISSGNIMGERAASQGTPSLLGCTPLVCALTIQ